LLLLLLFPFSITFTRCRRRRRSSGETSTKNDVTGKRTENFRRFPALVFVIVSIAQPSSSPYSSLAGGAAAADVVAPPQSDVILRFGGRSSSCSGYHFSFYVSICVRVVAAERQIDISLVLSLSLSFF
jgi:hypothetical protein